MHRKSPRRSLPQQYDVFLSYRREGGAAEARLIRSALEQHGVRGFLDVTNLGSGHFDESLLKVISETPNFVVLLSPSALERCSDEKDWLRLEIKTAISAKRNIVPIILPGFAFPEKLASEIAELARYQGVEYSHTFFDATIHRLLQLVGKEVRDQSGLPAVSSTHWVGTFSKDHPLLLGLAVLLTVGASYSIYRIGRNSGASLEDSINDLRSQYHDAVNALVLPGTGKTDPAQKYIARAELDVNTLMQADPNNGHALYYSGELKRIEDRTLFSPKSCPIAAALKSAGELDPYESDFYQYLDHEGKLPTSETGGNDSSDLCYSRLSGYCPQRTAWISHLLANDSYDEASLSNDRNFQKEKLQLALGYAQTAAKLYHDAEGVPGFSQCTPTTDLIRLAQEKLTELHK